MLVTGASGFIGQVLCRQLLALGCRLRVLQRTPEQSLPAGLAANLPADLPVDIALGDLCGHEHDLHQACADIDVIFHLAAQAHVNHSSREGLIETNVHGTRRLLQAAQQAGVRRIVFFSSILAATANTDYGESKREAEKLLLTAAGTDGIEVCCLRPANVYGPGMQGNLQTLIRLIRKRVFPPLPADAGQMSLVGVEDLCQAALLAAINPQANGKTYTVTDGQSYALRDVEQAIRLALGQRLRRWSVPLWLLWLPALLLELAGRLLPGQNLPGLRSYRMLTADSRVSGEAICHELGYTPHSTFYTALLEILEQQAGIDS
ncbi:MAG: NAD-dependent epimerase/dehydratase family protein [Pseudomonadales bacterium]|nr:NAD-dependent epimerase/dehydratase family protein [Pseudomonadales bacterium]